MVTVQAHGLDRYIGIAQVGSLFGRVICTLADRFWFLVFLSSEFVRLLIDASINRFVLEYP